MSLFFANFFSRQGVRLLILLVFMGWLSPICLESSNLKKEMQMPKPRKEVPENDCWDVSALYASPEVWVSDFLELKSEKRHHFFLI